mmetsp:Transcript_439/g.827  ORF Transcript_439/g.827 Transcript_439/m.827 type:complete len:351 (+) Transcript_439:77-1129(+)
MSDVFLVERLLGERRTNVNQRQFAVRWQGYGPKADSWELENDIEPSLVGQFDQEPLKASWGASKIYVVAGVIERNFRRAQLKVHWWGFPSSWDSWVDETNIRAHSHADHLERVLIAVTSAKSTFDFQDACRTDAAAGTAPDEIDSFDETGRVFGGWARASRQPASAHLSSTSDVRRPMPYDALAVKAGCGSGDGAGASSRRGDADGEEVSEGNGEEGGCGWGTEEGEEGEAIDVTGDEDAENDEDVNDVTASQLEKALEGAARAFHMPARRAFHAQARAAMMQDLFCLQAELKTEEDKVLERQKLFDRAQREADELRHQLDDARRSAACMRARKKRKRQELREAEVLADV